MSKQLPVVIVYGVMLYQVVGVDNERVDDDEAAPRVTFYAQTKPRLRHEADGDLHKYTLTADEGLWLWSGDDIRHITEPLVVLTRSEDHLVVAEPTPLKMAVEMFPGVIPKVQMRDISELVQGTASTASKALALDEKHGMPIDATSREMMRIAPIMEELAKNGLCSDEHIPDDVKAAIDASLQHARGSSRIMRRIAKGLPGDPGEAHLDGETCKYYEAESSEFPNGCAFMVNDRPMKALMARVAHIDPPTYHELHADADAELWGMGYRGYWQFPKAAVGQNGPSLDDGHHEVAFHVCADLKVYVKSADAICPAGRACLPDLVVKSIGGDVSGEGRTVKQAAEFNRTHALPSTRPDDPYAPTKLVAAALPN